MVTPPRQQGMVIGYWEATKNVSGAARFAKVPRNTADGIIKKHKADAVAETPTKRSKKSLSDRAVRRLRREFDKDPFLTRAEVAPDYGVHRTTLARYLDGIGLFSRTARAQVFLDERKVLLRLDWAATNLHRDWCTVIFTDEAIFQTKAGGKLRCNRPRGKKFAHNAKYGKVRHRSGWSSVHVWGALAYGKRYPLLRVDEAVRAAYPEDEDDGIDKLNSERYSNLILFERISRYAAELALEGREGLVVEDGASIHTSRLSRRTRADLGITSLDHPPSSPDLNPIEHLWAIIKQRISKRRIAPRTQEDLWRAIVAEYEAIPQSILDALVMGMVDRPAEVVEAKGWHTGH